MKTSANSEPSACAYTGAMPYTHVTEDGIVFAAAVPEREKAVLLIYDKRTGVLSREIPFPDEPWSGRIFAMRVRGLSPSRIEYNYRVGAKIVTDPCAQLVSGRRYYGKKPEGQIKGGFVKGGFSWGKDKVPLRIPYRNSVFYELNVRSYTKGRRSGVRHKGTFAGLAEKVPYLKDLGITAVVLMPCYEFDENEAFRKIIVGRPSPGKSDMSGSAPVSSGGRASELFSDGAAPAGSSAGKDRTVMVNLWGFGPGYRFAPKSSYCASDHPYEEFCRMVKAFHEAGIEVILEMDFQKETDLLLMLNVLLWWRRTYHIDGFFLYGKQNDLNALSRNPALSGCKLISDYFQSSEVYPEGRKGSFRNLAECNYGFRNDSRKLLKGDGGVLKDFVMRSAYNPTDTAVVNTFTGHDGFTLMDLVSYNDIYNDKNAEGRDRGAGPQYSWNCGSEGFTRKRSVIRLRIRQIKNAFSMMFLAQGTPMLLAGDEFGNSQGGNANAWCFDGPLTWLDWTPSSISEEILVFVRKLSAFRRNHPILHEEKELSSSGRGSGYPPFSCHGVNAWFPSYGEEDRSVGMMYCGRENIQETFLYVAYNFHWETRELALPNLHGERKWKMVLGTFSDDGRQTETGKTDLRPGHAPKENPEENGRPAAEDKVSDETGTAIRNGRYIEVPGRSILVLES